MKFIIVTVIISTSLRVNLAQIMFSPIMGKGGDERISKIAVKKSFFPHHFEHFPSAVSTFLFYFLNIFSFCFYFKVPFAKILLLNYCCWECCWGCIASKHLPFRFCS